ncbi:MAG: enoyl-ACP reductase [Nitrospinota bacterium]
MTLLEGKTALIFGVANDHSIAWGIAKVLRNAGCTLGFSYAAEPFAKRVKPLAESVGAEFVEECDVASDEAIAGLFNKWKEKYGSLDILVHSIAFADRNDLKGEYYNTTRDGFKLAMDISVYSLVSLTKYAVPLMEGRGASIITLTFFGAEKVVRNYNVMGIAKSALEASVRYLAADLGQRGVRVNAISAGPVKTLAASGIGGFRAMLNHHAEVAPMRRNVTLEEVGKSALYLCSDLSSGVTGEVIHVDCGAHIMAVPQKQDDDKE